MTKTENQSLPHTLLSTETSASAGTETKDLCGDGKTVLPNSLNHSDLTLVVKALQTISDEIVLDRLLDKLLKIIVENIGAEKGFLILKKGDSFIVEVCASSNRNSDEPFQPVLLDDCEELSGSVVRCVIETCQNVILNGTQEENLFAGDSYVTRNKPKSILCAPIMHHGNLTGIVYLETGSVPGAFTPERVEMLRLLSSQAAISIENAKLYMNLEASEKSLRKEISERRALEKSEKQYAFIANTAREFMTFISRDYVYEAANESYCKAHGKRREEIIGKTARDLWGEEVFETIIKERLDRCFAGEEVREEPHFTFPDLGERDFSVTYYPYRNEKGEITHAVVVSFDITDRKRAEEEVIKHRKQLEDYSLTLELRVEERTRELREKNEQLRQEIHNRLRIEGELRKAKEAADAANRAKSEFLASMSHEIRTPMNAVIGMAELALKTELTPKQQYYLNTIRSSAHSLLGLLDDILDLSKIEAGKLEVKATAFHLRDLLNDSIALFHNRIREKNIGILSTIDEDVPCALTGDPLRLRQILVNLLGNAVKFTEKGQIRIEVFCLEKTQDEVQLEFSVKDTGIGIPSDQIERIFAPFTQADSSTTRKYGGSGLGLAICNRLVNMMKGKIWVENEPHAPGATFRFTARFGRHFSPKEQVKRVERPCHCLPFGRYFSPKEQASEHIRFDKAVSSESERIEPRETESLNGAYVLLVEDNSINQQVAMEILRSAGIRVDIADNGREAIRLVEENGYDAVLMDVQMPEMDGFEATKRIRCHRRFEDLPIIALTAHAMRGNREQCIEAGMNDYVSKPLNVEMLLSVLRKWTKRKRCESVRPQEHKNASPCALSFTPGSSPFVPIDVEEALRRMGGEEEFFREILDKFSGMFGNITWDIRNDLCKQDMITARKRVHTLKGTAANISAKGLQGAASELEKALTKESQSGDGSSSLEVLLNNLDHALKHVLEFIRMIGNDQ